MTAQDVRVTALLKEWARGDAGALDQLVPLVYNELRRIAARALRNERPGHTLQPTALVNEAYLRLINQQAASWENRVQFFAVAAEIMRRLLVDHARARLSAKRGGRVPRVSLSDAEDAAAAPEVELLEIDQALVRLARLDPGQARIVELRFFAGLTVEETAKALDRSPRTIKREWRLAKAWLHRDLALTRRASSSASSRKDRALRILPRDPS